MSIIVKILGRDDRETLTRVAAEVFDHQVRDQLRDEFLRDPRHHLTVAIDLDLDVDVGMASGVH